MAKPDVHHLEPAHVGERVGQGAAPMSVHKAKVTKKKYERIETFYEGENGAPWVTWLNSKEVDGWTLESAEVTRRIDEKRFCGKVSFRREMKP
jgi:hypothetical protein